MRLPDLIDTVRPSVVQITYTVLGLPHNDLVQHGAHGAVVSFPIGTGFLVSADGLVVTAKHVTDSIAGWRQTIPNGKHHVGVGFAHAAPVPGSFRVITFDVIAEDARNDIALLRLTDNPFAMDDDQRRDADGYVFPVAVPPLKTSRPRDGASIAIAGYPLMHSALVTTAGSLASVWSPDFDDVLRPDGAGGYLPADIEFRYLADAQANPGNSGGPVFDVEDASVVGMLVAAPHATVTDVHGVQVADSSNLGLVIASTTIASFLTAQGVPLESIPNAR